MMLTTGTFTGNLVHADQVTALVPAYFYPTWWEVDGSPWDDLNAAAARIPIEAIMNPDSGPGTAVNSDYVVAVNELHEAGERSSATSTPVMARSRRMTSSPTSRIT